MKNKIINFYLTPPRLVVTAFRQSTPPWEGNLDCAKNGADSPPGAGGTTKWWGGLKKRTIWATKDHPVASRHPSTGGELAFCNPHKKTPPKRAVFLSFLLFVFFLFFDCHCCQWACQHSLQANFIARYNTESVCAVFNSFQCSIYFL